MSRKGSGRGLALFLAAALLISGCETAGTQEVQQEEAVAVVAGTPQVGTLAVTNEFVGTVSPQQQVSVIPLVTGKVDAVYFEVGDEVSAGDVLFHIDDEAAALQLESAQLSRQSVEDSAQRTLGSGQVLSNISMESNIKSIQYQIDMAKQQYNAAANGVSDAQEAREDIDKAIDQINESVDGLQSGYNQMKQLVAEAKRVIELRDGAWQFQVFYKDMENGAPRVEWWETDKDGSSDSAEDQSESAAQGGLAPDAAGGGGETALADDGADKSDEGDGDEGDGADKAGDGVGKDGGDQDDASVSSNDVADAGGRAEGGFYFAREITPAAQAGNEVASEFESYEVAMAAYQRQLAVDQLEAGISQMDYSAQDLGEGRVDEALAQYASQIASMKSQAATLESNKASLDSSITSAETTRDTTKRTIDFYEDSLQDAQATYEIQNGQAYQDSAAALGTQLQSADVGVKSARLQLENYTVTTPISGKIVSKNVEEFGMVQAGYVAYVISNDAAMNVNFYVSEGVRRTLQPGEKIALERAGSTYEATITQIGEAVDAQTGLFAVEAVTEVGGDALAGGLTVKVKADTYRTDNAILIPYDAVYFESEQAYVYCVVDGVVKKTAVQTGLYDDDTIEITEGLSADSLVVQSWSAQLEDGVKARLIGEAAQEEAE